MSSYATCTIAGVSLVDGAAACKNHILDGANLRPTHIGVNRYSASGAVFSQVLALSAIGAKFGVKSVFLPASVLSAVIAAINSAMLSAGSFPVVCADEIQSFTKTCVPDYEAGWVTYPGEQRTDSRAIKDVVFRFVVVA